MYLFVFDIQIYQDRSHGIIGLSPKKKSYIKKDPKIYNMQDIKSRDTHVIEGDKFNLND